MERSNKTKFLIKVFVFIIISFTLFVFWKIDRAFAINNCNDGWQISSGSNKIIKCHEVCKKVINNCSNPIFVPTKTSEEWANFIDHKPSCVSWGSTCQSNHTDACDGKCEYDCGASSQCDEKSPNYTWTSGSTCYWCNSSCSYGSSSAKPSSYYLSGNTCYYNCSVTCQVGGWSRSSCSSQSCPPTKVSGNYCYYNRSCTSSGCKYNSYDTNKECDTSVCTTSGWDNSSCGPTYRIVCNNAMGFSCQSWCQINFGMNCAFIAASKYATGPSDSWSWRLWFYDPSYGCCNVTYRNQSKYNCNTVISEQCPSDPWSCYCTCGAPCPGVAYSTVCYCQ